MTVRLEVAPATPAPADGARSLTDLRVAEALGREAAVLIADGSIQAIPMRMPPGVWALLVTAADRRAGSGEVVLFAGQWCEHEYPASGCDGDLVLRLARLRRPTPKTTRWPCGSRWPTTAGGCPRERGLASSANPPGRARRACGPHRHAAADAAAPEPSGPPPGANSAPGCGRPDVSWPAAESTGASRLPGGHTYTLPCTASDHRALRNAAHELAGLGVDLRRPNENRHRRETA